jgi:ribonuclease BN (tRNA processing enzyme)
MRSVRGGLWLALALGGLPLACSAASSVGDSAAGSVAERTTSAALPAAAAAARTTRLILLGTQGGPVSRGNRAQTASLLIVRGTPYLIDAGNGVARQLALAHVQPAQIHQIFITHNHDDHNADWGTLMGLAWSTGSTASTTVYGPVGTASMLAGFLQYFAPNVAARYAEGVAAPAPQQIMHAREIHGGLVYEDANIRVTAVENCHYHFPKGSPGDGQQSFALRFQTSDRVIVFSGDTGSCGDTLVNFARGADILVHEVIDLPEIEQLMPASAPAAWRAAAMNHMRTEHSTPEEVGRVASAAGVKQVVLSHVVPGLATDSDSLYTDGVRKFYSGPVSVGQDLQEY